MTTTATKSTAPTCPTWCDRQDLEHLEPDELTEHGLKIYGVKPGTQVRTHARDVATPEISGHLIGISIEQNEMIRDGLSEFAPLTVAVYTDTINMTAAEARVVASLLRAAADQIEATR